MVDVNGHWSGFSWPIYKALSHIISPCFSWQYTILIMPFSIENIGIQMQNKWNIFPKWLNIQATRLITAMRNYHLQIIPYKILHDYLVCEFILHAFFVQSPAGFTFFWKFLAQQCKTLMQDVMQEARLC